MTRLNYQIFGLISFLEGTVHDISLDLKIRYEIVDIPNETVIQILAEHGYQRCKECKCWCNITKIVGKSCSDCFHTDLTNNTIISL